MTIHELFYLTYLMLGGMRAICHMVMSSGMDGVSGGAGIPTHEQLLFGILSE